MYKVSSKTTKDIKKEKLYIIRALEDFRAQWKPSYITDKPAYEISYLDCGIEEIKYVEGNRYLYIGVFRGGKCIDINYQSKWSDNNNVTADEKKLIAFRVATEYTDWIEGVCPLISW